MLASFTVMEPFCFAALVGPKRLKDQTHRDLRLNWDYPADTFASQSSPDREHKDGFTSTQDDCMEIRSSGSTAGSSKSTSLPWQARTHRSRSSFKMFQVFGSENVYSGLQRHKSCLRLQTPLKKNNLPNLFRSPSRVPCLFFRESGKQHCENMLPLL